MNRFAPYLELLEQSLQALDGWRESFGRHGSEPDPEPSSQIREILRRLEKRLEGNYPFHHPRYAGQMLKPPHPVAWLAYCLAATLNPNNHALDGGPPTSEMEKEVIRKLASMTGYRNGYLGHLTSSGTAANLEALFVARETHPGKAIAATANAHYTHRRMCRVLHCEFIEIPVDEKGWPDLDYIKTHAGRIGTLVVTMGTTGLGFVEPLDELKALADRYDFRIHADAAYGGFFKLIAGQLPSARHWSRLPDCDSVVMDPHKHGLQPYGCGSVLYRDARTGRFFKHDSPYTYFTSADLHLGEISLECSRAGASAAALWATLQLLPLDENGLGAILKSTRAASLRFSELLRPQEHWQLFAEPSLDIAGYFMHPRNKTLSSLNRLSREIFNEGMVNPPKQSFYLSLLTIPSAAFTARFPEYRTDEPRAVILRSVFMKEEHLEFTEELVSLLLETGTSVSSRIER